VSEEFREGIDPRRAPQVVVGEYPVGEAYLEPINTVMRATNKGQTPLKFVAVQVSPPEMPDAVAASEN
jgi:hypothetical protein